MARSSQDPVTIKMKRLRSVRVPLLVTLLLAFTLIVRVPLTESPEDEDQSYSQKVARRYPFATKDSESVGLDERDVADEKVEKDGHDSEPIQRTELNVRAEASDRSDPVEPIRPSPLSSERTVVHETTTPHNDLPLSDPPVRVVDQKPDRKNTVSTLDPDLAETPEVPAPTPDAISDTSGSEDLRIQADRRADPDELPTSPDTEPGELGTKTKTDRPNRLRIDEPEKRDEAEGTLPTQTAPGEDSTDAVIQVPIDPTELTSEPVDSAVMDDATTEDVASEGIEADTLPSAEPAQALHSGGGRDLSPQVPLDPPDSIELHNPKESGGRVHYVVAGNEQHLDPGQSRTFQSEDFDNGSTLKVIFHRGGRFEDVEQRLTAGRYRFQVTDQGWKLEAIPRFDEFH